MRRRDFIAGFGSAAAWPVVGRAQQDERVRRVAVLQGDIGTENEPAYRTNLTAFREEMAKLGWIEGRNLRLDHRAGAGDLDRMRSVAAELVGLEPHVIVTRNVAATRALLQQTQSIPVIFAGVGGDPVATGLVGSIARPDRNATGFTNSYYSMGGKWLELLKEAAPQMTKVAIIFAETNRFRHGDGYASSIEAAAQVLGLKLIRIPVSDALTLVRAIDALVDERNLGLLWVAGPTPFERELLIRLADQYRLPSIYDDRSWVTAGGFMSYGADTPALYRGAASYVDRVLRGAKVSELPVQYPTKFELVINLKTMKQSGFSIPPSFLVRADEVIE